MRKTLVVLILLVLTLQITLSSVRGFNGAIISDPLSAHEVIVDGKWTYPDEWSDAVKVALYPACKGCSPGAYLYAKHDESCFYFMIDIISATKLDAAKDGASISIDSSHDGGLPNSDDRRFDAHFPANGSMAVGTGGTNMSWGIPLPKGVYMAASISPSPNSAVPHEIFEFKVTFSAFPNAMQSIIGLAASAYTATQLLLWPANYTAAAPTTWGEAMLSPTPIPEFNFVGLIVAISLTILLTVLARFRSGKFRARRRFPFKTPAR